jgi:hypothetical protein
MTSADDKSLRRGGRSLIRLADIAVGTAAAAIPGGGVSYELVKRLFDHAREYVQQRNEDRLLALHQLLLEGLAEEDRTALLGQEFSANEYTTLLNLTLSDEEDEKVFHYARLLRGLVTQSWDSRTRRHLIKAFKALASSDFDFLLELIDVSHSAPAKSGVSTDRLTKSLAAHDPFSGATLQALTNWGFVARKDRAIWPSPTPLAEIVSTLLGPN